MMSQASTSSSVVGSSSTKILSRSLFELSPDVLHLLHIGEEAYGRRRSHLHEEARRR
jgi:hypothetical protein